MRGDGLSTQLSFQNTWQEPFMHFSCKEIKHLKSISDKYLMLPLKVQENKRNIELLGQVTDVSSCAPPETKQPLVLLWDDLSYSWPFPRQKCRRHRVIPGPRAMSAVSCQLTRFLSVPVTAGEEHPLRWACLSLLIIPFEFLPVWMSAAAARPLHTGWEMLWRR